tara:strand:- start:7356 stop:8099 length:744 start_codon:yes stop_codon:yes gene_type:complete
MLFFFCLYLYERNLKGIQMKKLLSENMLRFGTKNLTESAKRKLVFESIMQTIKEHGLQSAVRRSLLTEGDAPEKNYFFKEGGFNEQDLKKLGVKFAPTAIDPETGTWEHNGGPLAYQSSTSLAEAQQIIQELIRILGKSGTDDGALLAKALGKITANNYYLLLWKVRYGSSFKSIAKSNYNTITDWISKKGMDIPSEPTSGRVEPFNVVRNWFQDPTVFNAVKRLSKYNYYEGRGYSMDGTPRGSSI